MSTRARSCGGFGRYCGFGQHFDEYYMDPVLVVVGIWHFGGFGFLYYAFGLVWKFYGQEDSNGVRYLGALGLWFQFVLGVMGLFLLNNLVSYVIPNAFGSKEAMEKRESIGFIGRNRVGAEHLYIHKTSRGDIFFPCLGRGNGLSEDGVKELLKNTWSRAFSVLVLCAQAALNIWFFTENLFSLPERDPKQPLNEARHYVAYAEATFALWFFVVLINNIFVARRAGNSEYGPALAKCADSIKRLAHCSAFKLLTFANPHILMEDIKKVKQRTLEFGLPQWATIAGTVHVVVGRLPFGIVGVWAMAVKLTQLDFISTTLWWALTMTQCFKVLGFTANVASIYDVGSTERDAVKRFLVSDVEYSLMSCSCRPIWSGYQSHLVTIVEREFGTWKSFLVAATLDANDLKDLLVPSSPYIPDLMKKILTVNENDIPITGGSAAKVAKRQVCNVQAFLLAYPNYSQPSESDYNQLSDAEE